MSREESVAKYECPLCLRETPMSEAKQSVGQQMFLKCAHCGQQLHNAAVMRMQLLHESRRGKKP